MNAYKASFAVLGLMYLVLFLASFAAPSKISFSIALSGIALCATGWFMADRYL